MFGESYLGILQTLVSPVTAIIMLVVVAICAFIGALIAKKLLKKHFKKDRHGVNEVIIFVGRRRAICL